MIQTQFPGVPPCGMWTKDEILALIDRCLVPGQEDGKTIYRMLHALYERQTAAERASHASQEHNGRGFTKFDAELLSDIAQRAAKYGSLTPKQTQLVGRRLRKYHRQLVEIANEAERRRSIAETATPSALDAGLSEVAGTSGPAQPDFVEF